MHIHIHTHWNENVFLGPKNLRHLMRVLPTNTTTPRYNNKYIRVSSRNNFPPPSTLSPVCPYKLVLRLSSSCVPQRSLINIAATELAGGFSSRSLSLPLPFPFSTPRADSEAASGILSWLCPNELTQFVCVAPAEFSFVFFSRTLSYVAYAQHSMRSKRKI